MKNLKKVLALVLVVATLFGFATVVGATDFSDSASVKNTEAVEVMNALGVINGYTDGSFKPGNNVTRAEMAKMVTAILNGGEDVGPLYSAANVFTDCGYHWARGYIAYATQVKLVAGIGNGKFNPDGNVTGTEAAKMLLCALGYEPEREGLVGTTWAAKTLSLAREAGLTDGFAANFDFSKPLSRDNAALLMLNALKADMVEYSSDAGTVIVGGVEVITGGARSHVVTVTTASNSWAEKINTDKEDSRSIVQLGEKSFNGDLTLAASGKDAFGRPSLKWTYKKTEIGTYNNATPVLTYTSAVKPQNIYEDLDLSAAETIDKANIYVNGAAPAGPDNKNVVLNKADPDYKTNIGYTGNGVTTEIYEDGDTYRIVVSNEYLAKVTSVVKAKGDDARKIRVEYYNAGSTTTNKEFETEDFEKNDMVLVTVANGDIKSVKDADIREDVAVTGYKANDNVTAGGTKYEYSATCRNFTEKGNTYEMGSNDSYTIYLDSNGYVIWGEPYSVTNSNFIYVLGQSSTLQGDGTVETAYFNVKYIDGEGKVSTAKAAAIDGGDHDGNDDSPVANNTWYTVSDDSDNEGYKEFTAVSTTEGDATHAIAATPLSENSSSHSVLNKTTPKIAANGKINANASTIFVLKTEADKDTFATYTGIANIPSYEKDDATDVNVTAVVVDSYAKVVYVDVSAMDGANTADDLIYLFDTTVDGTEASDGKTYDVHDAIVDGKETTVKVHKGYPIPAAGLVKVKSYDADGFISKVEAVPNSGDYVSVALVSKVITYSEPTLTVDGTSYLTNSDTAVYTIDADDNVEIASLDALVGTTTSAAGNHIYMVLDSDVVTAIYFDAVLAD